MTTVLLAAGMSKRMGTNKLLLPYKGMTIFEHTLIHAVRNSDRVIVVIGFEKEKIRAIASRYPVEIRENPDYEKGHRTSQNVGSEGLDDDAAYLNADMPLLEDEVWREGKRLLKQGHASRPVYNGEVGNPVFVPRKMMKGLRESSEPFKVYLAKAGMLTFEGTPGSVYDIDTPEKYRESIEL